MKTISLALRTKPDIRKSRVDNKKRFEIKIEVREPTTSELLAKKYLENKRNLYASAMLAAHCVPPTWRRNIFLKYHFNNVKFSL